jgi:hypothetical protein
MDTKTGVTRSRGSMLRREMETEQAGGWGPTAS